MDFGVVMDRIDNVMSLQMVLGVSVSIVGLLGLANGESGLLILARAGGRYDPFQLLNGKSEELWGVNQCILDEQEGFHNHTIKGNFRSPRVDNLTSYEVVKLELVVFNKFGEELLNVKNCELDNMTSELNCTDDENKTVSVLKLDGMGGIQVKNTSEILAVMFDRRYYFDKNNRSETILVRCQGKPVRAIDTGYRGCFRTDKSLTQEFRKNVSQPTVQTCVSLCPEKYVAAISQDNGRALCSCIPKRTDDSFTLGERVGEDECSDLCEANLNQTCGGPNATVMFDVNKYTYFKDHMHRERQTQELGTFKFEGNLTQMFELKKMSVVQWVRVNEEEECKLTNSFFNVSTPEYKLSLSVDPKCAGTTQSQPRVVSARDEPWHLGYYTAGCVIVEPLPHNCTYHMATFTFYGYSAHPKASDRHSITDMIELFPAYIGIRGEWFIEAPKESEVTAGPSTNASSDSDHDSTKTDNNTEINSDTVTDEDSGSVAVTSSGIANNESVVGDDEFTGTTLDSASLDGITTNSFTAELMQLNSTYETTQETTETNTDPTSTKSTTFRSSTSFGTGTTVSDFVSNITTPIPAVRQACTCVCKQKPLAQNQTKVMAAKEKAIKIQKKLKIDTMNLSSSVRKKVSAPDTRTTAAVGGYLGIVLLAISLGSLILADLTSIGRHIRFFRNRKPGNKTKKCK